MNYEKKYLKYKNKYLRLKQYGGFPSTNFKENLKIIGLENMINLILVQEGVRPAMLVQPADQGETTGADPVTKKILDAMKIDFPDLLYSEKYDIYQGIIISKVNYDDQTISLEKMGEILGYPCYKDFETLDRSQITYVMSVNALFDNGEKIEIFVNICKDNVSEIFEEYCRKANSVFSKEEYISLLGRITFTLETRENIPPHKIIDKLIKSEPITFADTKEISNIIYNFGFKMGVSNEIIENIQYTNSIHKGILISLLINHINDILSPFYPLQFYPEQKASVFERIESWGNQVIDTIMKTRT